MADYNLVEVSDLDALENPSNSDVLPIQDGSGLKKITYQNLKTKVVSDEATARQNADNLKLNKPTGGNGTAGQMLVTNGDGSTQWVSPDTTLATTGEAADAKATGDAIKAVDANLAAPYSTSATYAVGDYCTKDGQLYRCTTAISTAEAWTASHWTAVAMGEEVSDLRSALSDVEDEVYTYTSKSATTEASGWRLNESNGLCSSDANYKLVKYQVTAGDRYKIVSDDRFQFQSTASVPSSGASNKIGAVYGIGTFIVTAPVGATYLIVSTLKTNSQSAVYTVGSAVDELDESFESISANTRNIYTGEYSSLINMGYTDNKYKNTATDTRSSFFCVVRFRSGETNVVVTDAKFVTAVTRKSYTVTLSSQVDNIYILHNGSVKQLAIDIPIILSANKTYTLSFNVEGYDVQNVGGLIISEIQVEEGNRTTEYIPHKTATDYIAREVTKEASEIIEKSSNLFDGQYSELSYMELVNGKLKNTATDTRSDFVFIVRYRSGSTIVDSAAATVHFTGRVSLTLNATGNADNILICHNGAVRNFAAVIPFDISTGDTYTVSLNVDNYDVQTVGGLVLSDVQIEAGDIATPYIPDVSAIDYVAREEIDSAITDKNLNILLMGDSIFGSDGEIALYLKQMYRNCTNGAFGGTWVSVRPYTSDNFRFFDGENLVTALCTQTWTDQDTAAEALASSYPWITGRLATLKAVDMSKVDLLIMDWGTNDYTGGATIEDITTAYGAVIDLLQETYPELRILITTPIWRYWGTEADDENGDTKVYNVSTLKEIALAIEEFMKNKRISVLNAYQNLPLSYKTALTYFDENDKTHLNTFGNKVYAELLHGKIRSIY